MFDLQPPRHISTLRVAAVHWHWGEGPLATHSRRSAAVGTVGKHLISDSVPHPCRGRARSPEILAGNPWRNGLVYGNRAYEAFRTSIRAQSEFLFRCYSDPKDK